MKNTIETLQAIRDSEIDFQIETIWDLGFCVKLGGGLNPVIAEKWFRRKWPYQGYEGSLQNAIDWLVEQVIESYPDSLFTCHYQGREFDRNKCVIQGAGK